MVMPEKCPAVLKELAEHCWEQEDPGERMTTVMVVEQLNAYHASATLKKLCKDWQLIGSMDNELLREVELNTLLGGDEDLETLSLEDYFSEGRESSALRTFLRELKGFGRLRDAYALGVFPVTVGETNDKDFMHK